MKKILFLLFFAIIFLGVGCGKKENELKTQGDANKKNLETFASSSPTPSQRAVTAEKNESKDGSELLNNQPVDREKIENKDGKKEENNLNESKNEQKKISVNLTLDFGGKSKNLPANLMEGATVYDLLQKLQQEGKIKFRAKNYSFGVFIEEIDGIKNSQKEKKYWMFYVNDKLSEVGASGKKLNEGDGVVWKYEKQ